MRARSLVQKRPAHSLVQMGPAHHLVQMRPTARAGAVKGGGGDTPGKWFFNESLIGDVVVVTNSKEKTIKPDNGLNGWNMSWSEWQAGSAA
ncbi:hypothetical protein AB0F24_22850 [Streptomyces platensis]|uniref:hypothetical protein n=1 Tax=Streptomyces platensis TaxID=58346 RepID=UPI0033C43EDA